VPLASSYLGEATRRGGRYRPPQDPAREPKPTHDERWRRFGGELEIERSPNLVCAASIRRSLRRLPSLLCSALLRGRGEGRRRAAEERLGARALGEGGAEGPAEREAGRGAPAPPYRQPVRGAPAPPLGEVGSASWPSLLGPPFSLV
jgi:hypothetical protein